MDDFRINNEKLGGWKGYMMKRLIVLSVIVLAFAVNSNAVLVSSFDDHYGTASYSKVNFTGSIDYAVYNDTEDFENWTGFEAPGSGAYIYAYQIFNDAGPENLPVESFEILGSTGQSLAGAVTGTTAMDDGSGGVEPATAEDAKWTWTSENGFIHKGEHSWLLAFSSNAGPSKGTFDIQPVENDEIDVPDDDDVEIPEPATVMLFGLGGLIAMKKRTKAAYVK